MDRIKTSNTGSKFVFTALDTLYDRNRNPVFTIGHSPTSCTAYPGVYFWRDMGVCVCDCPGFEDNRGI